MIREIRRMLGLESNNEKVSTLLDIDSRLGEISTEISELAHNYTRRYEAKNEVLKSMSDDFIVTEVVTRFDLFEKSHLNELLPLKKEKDSLEYERLSLLKSKEVSELYQERQKFNILRAKYKLGEISNELYNIVLKTKSSKVKYSDVLVFNKEGELLLLNRARIDESQPEKWCLPGGHVDFEESHLIAAKRELIEETGLNVNENDLVNIGKFEDKDACIEYYRIVDVCIESNPIILQSEEHWNYKWISISELDNYEMPFNMKDNIKKVLGIEETEKKIIKSDANDFKAFIKHFLKAFNEGEISAEVLKNVIEKVKMKKIEVNKHLIEKSISAFRQGIISESSLKNIIEKARSGRYADNSESRRLKRVGREYGTKGKEEEKDPKDGKKDEQAKDKQATGDLAEQAKNSSVAQLEAAIKESPNPEVRQAAHNELARREKEEYATPDSEKKFGEDYKKESDQPAKKDVSVEVEKKPIETDKKESKSASDNKEGEKSKALDFSFNKKDGVEFILGLDENHYENNDFGIKDLTKDYIKAITNYDYKSATEKSGSIYYKTKNYKINNKNVTFRISNHNMNPSNMSNDEFNVSIVVKNKSENDGIYMGDNYVEMYISAKNLNEAINGNFLDKIDENFNDIEYKYSKNAQKSEEQDILVHEFNDNIDIEKTINTYEKWL